ncbi:MAG: thioredoxin [Candidatus Komeilibacteria bacterium]|nr:thioredoxin [Candidatus Komeilibacteria bacterium]
MPNNITDQNFNEEVLQSEMPVLIDFYAPWCGPCKMMEPHMEELTQEYAGKVKIVKLNVDENPETAQQFQVMSIPTLFIFKDGQVIQQMVGYQDKSSLQNKLNSL